MPGTTVQRILLIGVMASACVGTAAGTAWLTGCKDQGVKRWSKLVSSSDDKTFQDLIQSAPVKGPIPWKPDWWRPFVSVYSFPMTQTPPVTLRDLTAVGQAHATDFLAKNTKAEPHTWSNLQEALANTRLAAAGIKDPFKFERMLVSTVTKGTDWDPGDRIIWARILVQPINFEFGDYSVEATQNVMDKIASIEAVRSNKIAADLTLNAPEAEGSKAELAPTAERSVTMTTDINSQYERLGVDIQRNFLRVIRESSSGGDVAGNVLIPLSLVTDPATIQKSFPEDTDKKSTSDDLVLIVTGTHLMDGTNDLDEQSASISVLPQPPLPHCPLLARVSMLYEQRHISKHREYYNESQQEVELIRKADGPKDVEIVPADDVSPAVWYIKVLTQSEAQSAVKGTLTNGNVSNNQPDPMLGGRVDSDSPYRNIAFSDYGQASAFAHWVRQRYKTKIGGLSLNYTTGASLVPFKMTDVVCRTKDKAHTVESTYHTN
jgi:hypothetical protein